MTSKQNFLFAAAAFCGLLFCAGCYCSNFSIESGEESSRNPCPVKFYVSSIEMQYSVTYSGKRSPQQKIASPQNVELIKQKLIAKYPDFFVAEKSKGVNVKFFWDIDYQYELNGTFFPSAMTFGILPQITFNDSTGKLAARNKDAESISAKPVTPEEGMSYSLKETQIGLNAFFTPVSGMIAALLMPEKDLKTSLFAEEQEVCRTPFQCCDANLRLFPAACKKFYDGLSREEKQELNDLYNPQDIIFLRK